MLIRGRMLEVLPLQVAHQICRQQSVNNLTSSFQIETLEQRKALMMAGKAFASAFSNSVIDEGNLRQRRYRLEKLMQTFNVAEENSTDEDMEE